MMKSITRLVTGKFIIAVLALSAVAFVAESCGNKHACGSKQQKRQRHKRTKRNTTFMTY
jgi:hypothetical protein